MVGERRARARQIPIPRLDRLNGELIGAFVQFGASAAHATHSAVAKQDERACIRPARPTHNRHAREQRLEAFARAQGVADLVPRNLVAARCTARLSPACGRKMTLGCCLGRQTASRTCDPCPHLALSRAHRQLSWTPPRRYMLLGKRAILQCVLRMMDEAAEGRFADNSQFACWPMHLNELIIDLLRNYCPLKRLLSIAS